MPPKNKIRRFAANHNKFGGITPHIATGRYSLLGRSYILHQVPMWQ